MNCLSLRFAFTLHFRLIDNISHLFHGRIPIRFAFSCPAISCLEISSVCFTSCNFTSSIFSAAVGHTIDRRRSWNKCRSNHCLECTSSFDTHLSNGFRPDRGLAYTVGFRLTLFACRLKPILFSTWILYLVVINNAQGLLGRQFV